MNQNRVQFFGSNDSNVHEILFTATKLRHFAFGHRDYASINIWDALHSVIVALNFAEIAGYQEIYDIVILHQFDIVEHILFGETRNSVQDREMNDSHVEICSKVSRATHPLALVKQKLFILKLELSLRGSLIAFIKARFETTMRLSLESQDTISLVKMLYVQTRVCLLSLLLMTW